MIKTSLLLCILFTSICSLSQEWQTNIEAAKKIASQEDKKIVLVFQGSDWCAPCMKLEKEIWSQEEFKIFAKENYVMLQADFPRRKANRLSKEQQEKNGALAEKYNQQGFFPHVVVLDKTGKVLGKTGYKKLSPKNYIKILESFKAKS
ncbi:MAG: thioredoxin family protein [Flavobacteriales bacterium]|nr:thioredoxin family protein [Flavobacteriales bacterium]